MSSFIGDPSIEFVSADFCYLQAGCQILDCIENVDWKSADDSGLLDSANFLAAGPDIHEVLIHLAVYLEDQHSQEILVLMHLLHVVARGAYHHQATDVALLTHLVPKPGKATT